MDLSYDWGFTGSQLNGNIAGVKWKTGASNEVKAYGFSYDRLNRLTGADYGEGSGWGNAVNDFSVGHLSYDANGNILTLQRKGKDMSGGTVTIDDLNYHYFNNSNQLAHVQDGGTGQGGFKDGNTGTDDYTYDANGNMSQDRNKEITGASAITYNHLNLPQLVTFTGNRGIAYTYDAAGIKLQKTVSDNGAVTVTDYIGGFIYEGGHLQQFAHEEGRVRQRGDGLVYDYYIKDHLGNTRLTLAGSPDTVTYLATMESEYVTFEESMFVNIPAAREVHPMANYTLDANIHANETVRLNGHEPGRRIGPGKVLQVTPGDRVTLETYAYYENNFYGDSTLGQTAIITALSGAFGGLNGGTTEQQAIYDLFNGHAAAIAVAGNAPHNDQPRAYLNYLLFDRDFNYVDAGFVQVSALAQVNHEQLSMALDITENGYLYVYLSNETGTDLSVYFDDLRVEHIQGIVLQEDHYYPFGATIRDLSFQRPAATARMETAVHSSQVVEEVFHEDYEGDAPVQVFESGEVFASDGVLHIIDILRGDFEAGSTSVAFPTVAGDVYEVSFEVEPFLVDARGDGDPGVNLYINGRRAGSYTDDGFYTHTFTAAGASATLLFHNTGGSAEGLVTTYLDNLTVLHHYTKTDTLERLVHTGEISGLATRFRYNDKEFEGDFDLNWYDYGARFYDPQTGRFMQVDPLANEENQENWTPYHYVFNNPIMYIDPLGLAPIYSGIDGGYYDDETGEELKWDQVQNYLHENDGIAFSLELGDDLKESIADSPNQGEALIKVVGAFTKLIGMTARRDAEKQLANTGDYQGYTYNKLNGTYAPRNGKWRTSDPVVEVDNSKIISGSGRLTVDGVKMGVNIYVPRLASNVGGYATAFDESENINDGCKVSLR